MRLGVLALQGGFEAHRRAFERAGVAASRVRTPRDLEGLEGLAIPGGESGVLLQLARENGLFAAIGAFHARGGAIMGTCAGAILLARRVRSPEQESLGLIDIDVARNAYGRQVDSFEADADEGAFEGLRLVFIRAPRIERVGASAIVLARHQGEPVAVREGRVLVATFHPELVPDASFHSWFVEHVISTPREVLS